jgi:DNA repair exonuclease SbcCD nuclease subunit
MRISIISDCHLNKVNFSAFKDKSSGLPYKSHDFMKSFEYMVRKNIDEIKPDLIVLAGDIYDTYDPSNGVRAFFYRQMNLLSEANIPVIVLVGNHDICKKSHALSPLSEIGAKGIRVIEEPVISKFKDHVLLLYPYSLSVERSLHTNKELFHKFSEEAKKRISNTPGLQGLPVIFFGHFGVKGAAVNLGKSTSGKLINMENTSSEDISIGDLDTLCADYVFLGDYHSHQILPTKNCISMYTGSIERDNVTHRELKKGFVVYDTNYEDGGDYGTSRFVEYPNCRPMVLLSGSLGEIREGVDKIDAKRHDQAAVKIVFEGDSKEAHNYHLALPNLISEIKEKIDPVHIADSQKIQDTDSDEAAKKMEEKIADSGHMSENEVMNVICEIIKEQVEEGDYDEVIKMAKEVRKEAKERVR